MIEMVPIYDWMNNTTSRQINDLTGKGFNLIKSHVIEGRLVLVFQKK